MGPVGLILAGIGGATAAAAAYGVAGAAGMYNVAKKHAPEGKEAGEIFEDIADATRIKNKITAQAVESWNELSPEIKAKSTLEEWISISLRMEAKKLYVLSKKKS